MKILLVVPGHLKTVPMSRFSEKALKQLGHEVVVEDYHANLIDKLKNNLGNIFVKDEQSSGVNQRIRSRLAQFKPDLLFTIYGVPLSKKTLDYARALGVVNACWWINDPFQFQRGLALAKDYDVWFSNSSECARQVQSNTGVKSFFLPTACDIEIHHPVEPAPIFASDVCFAGDWCKERQALVEFIIERGISVRIFGPWQKKIPPNSILHKYLTPGFFTPEQMVTYFSSAKIVLNYHTWYGKFEHGVNPRLFEAAACKTVQVVDAKLEIPDLFEVGKEIVTYNTLDELPSILMKLLSDNDMRLSVANAAYMRAISAHTYPVRMQQMLDYVTKSRAIG